MMGLFKTLDIVKHNTLRDAVDLMKDYANFEKTCNQKLRKMGRFIKYRADILSKEAFTTWYQNALKPTDLMRHNLDLCTDQYHRRLKHKAFYELFLNYKVT